MNKFSMPADFKTDTIVGYAALNRKYEGHGRIIETYGQITSGEIISSGRKSQILPKIDLGTLQEYVSFSKDNNIDFNYVLNPSCLGNFEFTNEGIKTIQEFLFQLDNIGVRSVTSASPAIMEIIKNTGLGFGIKASAICEISSPMKAAFYKEMGVERIVSEPDITRDFRTLKAITDSFGEGVEIIINSVCFKYCVFKMFCYNHEAHCSADNNNESIQDYFFNRCEKRKAQNKENGVKLNWIRPEDLKYYRQIGITNFKLAGRQNVSLGDPLKTIEGYLKEDFDGNLYDFLHLFSNYSMNYHPYIDNKKLDGYVSKFFNDPLFCQQKCDTCNYCKKYAEKSFTEEGVNKYIGDKTTYVNTKDVFSETCKVYPKERRNQMDENKSIFESDFSTDC